MGLKDRKQMRTKQKVKRRKKRAKLAQKGVDPDKFYNGNVYIGCKTSE